MPCKTIPVVPEVIDFDANIEPAINWRVPVDKSSKTDSIPFRRKPRFDHNVFIEEVVVDTMFKDYRYAISRERKRPLRPVCRDPNT
eukprot:7523606-Heterocapsa_arctica.AAC.1